MTKLRPSPASSANLMTKMFSGDEALSGRQFFENVSASAYRAEEFRILSTRFSAAWQASSGPATWMPVHELYAVALMPPAPAASLVKTPALMYMLARSASTAPLVTRPLKPASHLTGSTARAASSSDSMNLNNESRETRARGVIAVSGAPMGLTVASGTPPK